MNPSYHDNSKSKKYTKFPSLDSLILLLHARQGKDASRNLRMKDDKKILKIVAEVGVCGPVLDLALRSTVSDMLLNYFETEIPVMRDEVLDEYFKKVEHSEEVNKGFILWKLSRFCFTDFDTFLRNSRTNMLNAWKNTLRLKPQTVLLQ
jgi:hypothetical protein